MAKKNQETATGQPPNPVGRKKRVAKPLSPARQRLKDELREISRVEKITPHIDQLGLYGIEQIRQALDSRAEFLAQDQPEKEAGAEQP